MRLLQYLLLGSALSMCSVASPDAAAGEVAASKKSTSSKKVTTTSKTSPIKKHTTITTSSHHTITRKPTTTHPNTGTIRTFKPSGSSCIPTLAPANPTLNITLTSASATTITVGQYTPFPSASPSLQLEIKGTRFQYQSKASKNTTGVYIISEKLGSLQINNDLTFEYIAPNCSVGYTGTLPPPSSTAQSSTTENARAVAAATARPDAVRQRNVGSGQSTPQFDCEPGNCDPKVEVDLNLINQCWDIAEGKTPHLMCVQSLPGGANTGNSPLSDFEDQGNGLYQGFCEIQVNSYDLCLVGEAVCSDAVQGIINYGAELVCGIIGGLASDGIGAEFFAKLCSFAVEEGLDTFCKLEDLDGSFSQCPQAAVTPVVSMQYFAHLSSYTTQITLPSATGQALTTTISTTATALVPSCIATGNPYPKADMPDCEYYQYLETYVLCAQCYVSGLPWEKDIAYDIECNACCGCCYKAGTWPHSASSGDYGPQSVCCTQQDYMTNPNCYQDFCQVEEHSKDYTQDCNVLTAESFCNTPYGGVGHPFYECPSPNFESIFNPNGTSEGSPVCQVGDPPPWD